MGDRISDGWPRLTLWRAGLVYLGVLVVAGLFAGWLWHTLSTPPNYTIGDDQGAIITEQGLSQAFAMDIWFMFIGLAVGLAVGVCSWALFHRWGWPMVVMVVVGSLLAALLAWQFGSLLGPHDFADRIALAVPGDRVPMDLELHSIGLMLVWPLAAYVPVFVLAVWNQARRVDR